MRPRRVPGNGGYDERDIPDMMGELAVSGGVARLGILPPQLAMGWMVLRVLQSGWIIVKREWQFSVSITAASRWAIFDVPSFLLREVGKESRQGSQA